MRIAIVLLGLLAAGPALAADSIADQAESAYAFFAGGMSQKAFLSAQYGAGALKAIAGNWVRLNGPDSTSGVETYGADTVTFCKSPAALTLASPTELTMKLTTNLTNTTNFSQDFTLIAGSTFAEHTDPAAYLGAVGLGPDKAGDQADQQRALLLSLANGLVQIYRPSDDILVMTRDRGYPIILARCPPDGPDNASSAPPDAPSSSAELSSAG